MRNIMLTIEFDGTAYHGWQSQINAVTVQDTVTAAVNALTGEACSLSGSSRTDAGVHAMGYVCNFHTQSAIPADKFAYALNTLLPADIVIKGSQEVSGDFHARFSARGKTYRYLICNSVFPTALLRNRAYHVYYPLDITAMQEAAGQFVGTHDFYAFSTAGGSVKTTVRTITAATVMRQDPDLRRYDPDLQSRNPNLQSQDPGLQTRSPNLRSQTPGDNLIALHITGDGFLYNMVRIIAGTLIEVGIGKLKPDYIPELIAGLDRRKAGRTAPAHGLYLGEVYY